MESFYEHVPQRLLPYEYGGEAGTLKEIANYWEHKILMYRDFILEWEHYGVNENLRPNKNININNGFNK